MTGEWRKARCARDSRVSPTNKSFPPVLAEMGAALRLLGNVGAHQTEQEITIPHPARGLEALHSSFYVIDPPDRPLRKP